VPKILSQFAKQDLCPNIGVEVPGVRGKNITVYVRKQTGGRQ